MAISIDEARKALAQQSDREVMNGIIESMKEQRDLLPEGEIVDRQVMDVMIERVQQIRDKMR